jgi:hypothetical protein
MLRVVCVAFAVVSLISWAGSVSAATLINNGLAPPNPANVIDDETYASDGVRVRDEGCPLDDACLDPGDSTEVALVEGGTVGLGITVSDSSILTMSGGSVGDTVEIASSATVTLSGGIIEGYLASNGTLAMSGGTVKLNLSAMDFSIVTMSGGTVEGHLFAGWDSTVTMAEGIVLGRLEAFDSASVTLSGGTIGDTIVAYHSSAITIEGTNFMVRSGGDPVAVPYGDLNALTGTLTGTLASGDPLDNVFFQGGGSYAGTISLVPEPSAALLQITAFAMLMGLAAKRMN